MKRTTCKTSSQPRLAQPIDEAQARGLPGLVQLGLLVFIGLLVGGCDLLGLGKEEPLGRLAFVAWDDEHNRSFVYTVNTDGTDLRQLTSMADSTDTWWSGRVPRGSASWPVWSPDGTQIAFTGSFGPDEEHIVVMNADGSNKREITEPGGYNIRPEFSPSGRYLLFLEGGFLGAVFAYAIADLHTGEIFRPENISPPPCQNFEGQEVEIWYTTARWAHDDEHLYVDGYYECTWGSNVRPGDLFLIRASDGSIVKNITQGQDYGSLWNLSRDGTKIVYLADSSMLIRALDVTDGTTRTIARSSALNARGLLWPRWANDSQHIVFGVERDGQSFSVAIASYKGHDVPPRFIDYIERAGDFIGSGVSSLYVND